MSSATRPLRETIDGVEYRIFDTTMRAGKTIIANPPAAWATARVFRPAEGHRRLYRLTEPADRATDPETLARQLRMSEFLPTEPPHEGATSAR